jgi:long-chain acyl-CoA synthetase
MSLLKKDFNSLHELLLRSANEIHTPDSTFMIRKVNGQYMPISYSNTLEKVDRIAAYLMSMGLEKGDRVAMVLENCPEYIYWDQAMLKLGLVNTAIYPTLSPEETQYIINDSGSKAIVLGTPFLLKKFQKIEAECPSILKAFLMFEGSGDEGKLVSYGNVLTEGEKQIEMQKEAVQKRFSEVGKDDLAALIYTSGTTGVPKGVMLSHYNFMSNTYDALELCPQINPQDRFLSFLPLSHVYERLVSYYLSTYAGCQIAFSEGIEKIATNLGEASPSILATVPRLLERMEEKIRKNIDSKGGLSKKIFYWSLSVGEKYRKKKDAGRSTGLSGLMRPIAEKLVFSKIKSKLGGNIKLVVSGGGALPQHIGEFFGNIGVQVQEGYGLTETSPFVSVNEFHRQVYGTVGRVAPSQKVALEDIESGEIIAEQSYDSFEPQYESGEGEILVKGPNVMLGYYNKPSETQEVFDKSGWFHTGDIGKFEKGYLKITDRKKNMLKTSLGKNIYPTPIENQYLQSSKIEQVFLIGDKLEYVTAIVVPAVDELLENFDKSPAYFEEESVWIEDEDVKKWLNEDIKKLGIPLAKYERLKDFLVKRKPFSLEDGEMTPTQKVKRKVVMEKYADKIKELYK